MNNSSIIQSEPCSYIDIVSVVGTKYRGDRFCVGAPFIATAAGVAKARKVATARKARKVARVKKKRVSKRKHSPLPMCIGLQL